MTEESREVAEARDRVWAWAHRANEDCPECEAEIGALIEAVRKDERRRATRRFLRRLGFERRRWEPGI